MSLPAKQAQYVQYAEKDSKGRNIADNIDNLTTKATTYITFEDVSLTSSVVGYVAQLSPTTSQWATAIDLTKEVIAKFELEDGRVIELPRTIYNEDASTVAFGGNVGDTEFYAIIGNGAQLQGQFYEYDSDLELNVSIPSGTEPHTLTNFKYKDDYYEIPQGIAYYAEPLITFNDGSNTFNFAGFGFYDTHESYYVGINDALQRLADIGSVTIPTVVDADTANNALTILLPVLNSSPVLMSAIINSIFTTLATQFNYPHIRFASLYGHNFSSPVFYVSNGVEGTSVLIDPTAGLIGLTDIGFFDDLLQGNTTLTSLTFTERV